MYGLVTNSPRLYVGSWFLWYSFVLLGRRVSDGVRGSVCDHVGYKSGTVLVYSYALTGPTALYAPKFHFLEIVCVFRLLSTKLQPPGGTIVTAPSGLRSRVCGQSLRPSLAPNHFWLPTTYLLLR